jgi:hypothetical protein
LCTAQNHSSSPDSSVVCSSISSGATYSIFLWKGETLFRVSLDDEEYAKDKERQRIANDRRREKENE